MTSPHDAEFFDSYGHKPCYFDARLCDFLSKYNTIYNPIHFQAPLSIVCGQYCLMFLMHRARGVSFNDILSLLDAVPSDVFVQTRGIFKPL